MVDGGRNAQRAGCERPGLMRIANSESRNDMLPVAKRTAFELPTQATARGAAKLRASMRGRRGSRRELRTAWHSMEPRSKSAIAGTAEQGKGGAASSRRRHHEAPETAAAATRWSQRKNGGCPPILVPTAAEVDQSRATQVPSPGDSCCRSLPWRPPNTARTLHARRTHAKDFLTPRR